MSCGVNVTVATSPRLNVSVSPNTRTVEVFRSTIINNEYVTNNYYGAAEEKKNITSITSGTQIMAVSFDTPFTGVSNPTVNATLVYNNSNVNHYEFTLYGISISGFWVEFSDYINATGYSLHSRAS